MKHISLLLMLLIVVGCKKSDDSHTGPVGTNCVLTQIYFSDNLQQGNAFYWHDSAGRILSQNGYPWMTDTTSRYYVYAGDALQYSFHYTDAEDADTTRYFYDGQSRLVKTTYHTVDIPFEYSGRTDYLYNSDDQVICTVMRLDTSMATPYSDSSVYTYTNGNVTQITSYWMNDTVLVSHTRHLLFDVHKNYYLAMKVPPVSFEYWSRNNITRIDGAFGEGQFVTISYPGYNAAGYPTQAVFHGSTNNITRNQEMFYECR